MLTILGEQAEQTCWEVEISGGLVMARMEILTEIFSSFGPNLYRLTCIGNWTEITLSDFCENRPTMAHKKPSVSSQRVKEV